MNNSGDLLNTEGPVLVIGAAGIDLVGRVRKELQPGTSTPAEIRTSFGGVARNVAENLAHLGHETILLSAVGEDEPGDQLLKVTQAAGVNIDAVLRVEDYTTGTYLGVVNESGSLKFALDDMRITQAITPAYLRTQQKLFKRASLIFVDGNLSPRALRTVFSITKRVGRPVVADPTSASLAGHFKPYLSQLHLITPNFSEASVFCGYPIDPKDRNQTIDAARFLVAEGVKIVIITLAEFGVCYASSETWGMVPAVQTEVIDPTGAGDAMSATVIFALLNDIPLDDAVRLGASSASLTLRHRGAVLPDLSLEKLYNHLVI